MIGGKTGVGIVPSVTGPGGAGRGGGFLMPSKEANLALVIRRNKCEPISGPNLSSFLSVVIWFVSVKSRKVTAAELVFIPVGTPYGGTGHVPLFLSSREVLFSRKVSTASTMSDSFVRAILIESGNMSCILTLNVLHCQRAEGIGYRL